MECLSIPIIGNIEVFSITVSKHCFRINSEILSDEILAVRNRKDLVSETAVISVEQVCVGICICLFRCLSGIYLRVVHHPVVSLVIKCRVVDDVILRNQTRIRTPSCVKLYSPSRCAGSLLGRDQYDAICTACAIDCRCCCIFKHCHRFHIVRVDIRDVSVVRHSVYYVERSIACAHRSYTTDSDTGTS